MNVEIVFTSGASTIIKCKDFSMDFKTGDWTFSDPDKSIIPRYIDLSKVCAVIQHDVSN